MENNNLVIISTCFLIFFTAVRTHGESSSTLRVTTLNTGLTPRVPHYDVRKLHVGEAIKELHSDIVCLQEVWYSDDMTRMIESTTDMYPYSYSAVHSEVGKLATMSKFRSPCLSAEFARVMTCITMQCGGTHGIVEYLTCARVTCRILERLDQSCITCLVITGSSNIADRCVGDFGTAFNVPGLLLLSKYPLKNVKSANYIPNTTLFLPRGFITAEVDGVGTVVCAHTTANLGYGNFEDLGYDTWEEQNLDEARILVHHLQNNRNVVLMGDLNSSPRHDSTGVVADMPGMCEYFTAAGYIPSYMDHLGICTWCLYNPISMARHTLVLDHVLVKNLTVVSVRRVFDGYLPHEQFPLSDHYGIEARVQRR